MITNYFLFLEAFEEAEIVKDPSSKGDRVRYVLQFGEHEIGNIEYRWTEGRITPAKSDIKGELYIIWVSSIPRKMGVGSRLIEKAIQDAKQLGLNIVTLKLPNDPEGDLSNNEYLRKFYEKLGFTYWGRMLNSEFMYMVL